MFLALLASCLLPPLAPAAPQTPSAELAAALARVRPTAAEERWRSIDWHRSLTSTLAEAKASGKPVFLFGYDGTLDDGNC